MAFEKTYTTMSSAKRGAIRAGLKSPTYTKTAEGRIVVTEGVVKAMRKRTSTVESPVDVFRNIFAAKYGEFTRKQIIDYAHQRGVSRGTAATYYQKLAAPKNVA